jgi:hypothetical protein
MNTSDSSLIERHEREIFPLLRQRRLFTDVANFLLYDFYTQDGFVNEDVYAYSNRTQENESSLVIYHNSYASTKGWIFSSAAFSVKAGQGEKMLIQKTIAEGLGIDNQESLFCIFRNQINGLEYIRSNQEIFEKGLYFELDAYKYHVYTGFKQVQDNEWRQYAHLTEYLGGSGVPSIEEAMKEIFLQPIHNPFRELVNPGFFQWIIDNIPSTGTERKDSKIPLVLDEAEQKTHYLLREIKQLSQSVRSEDDLASSIRIKLEAIMKFPILSQLLEDSEDKTLKQAIQYLNQKLVENSLFWNPLLGWLFTHQLGSILTDLGQEEVSRSWVDEWLLGKILANTFSISGFDENEAWRKVNLVKILIGHQNWDKTAHQKKDRTYLILQSWLRDREVQTFVGINRYQGVLWFNKESFDDLLWWMFAVAAAEIISPAVAKASVQKEEPEVSETGRLDPASDREDGVVSRLTACFEMIQKLQEAEDKSDYQVEKLLDFVKD